MRILQPLVVSTLVYHGPVNGGNLILRSDGSRAVNIQMADGEAFSGAGVPRPELPPSELPDLLMRCLKMNDFPEIDSGLNSMWAFAGDTTRFIYQNNITEFIEDAHETANTLPTSFYGMAMNGQSWKMEGEMNMVGNDPERCWIATQIMQSVSSDGRLRRWQWELRKHRRPPNLGAWYVESIGSSDRKGNFDIEG